MKTKPAPIPTEAETRVVFHPDGHHHEQTVAGFYNAYMWNENNKRREWIGQFATTAECEVAVAQRLASEPPRQLDPATHFYHGGSLDKTTGLGPLR